MQVLDTGSCLSIRREAAVSVCLATIAQGKYSINTSSFLLCVWWWGGGGGGGGGRGGIEAGDKAS